MVTVTDRGDFFKIELYSETILVCGQHGWWQACPEIGAPGYDPFDPEGAHFNLIIGNGAIDPSSSSVPQRAYLCQIRSVG